MSPVPLLLVDDNPLNLKLLRLVLTSELYDVRTAASAEEAMQIMNAFRPRLILLDVQLPGIDGLEFTRLLKQDEKTCDIMILAVTAFAMRGDEEKVMAAGCDGYIAKPINTRSLSTTVARFLESALSSEE